MTTQPKPQGNPYQHEPKWQHRLDGTYPEGCIKKCPACAWDKAIKQGKREAAMEIFDWLVDPCPHGTKAADTSRASRSECEICMYQDFKSKYLGESK